MRDFGGPTYRSYVALCRELRMERELAEGDWVWQNWAWLPGEEDDGIVGLCAHYDGGLCQPGSKMRGIVWLPTGDDWDEMLEAAGVRYVGILRRSDTEVEFGSARYRGEAHPTPMGPMEASASSIPEVKARLWMAVTGR